MLGVQGIAASSLPVIIKVAAEALSGAGRGRIRALKVRVRVVRRSGQRGRQSRRYRCGRAGPIEARCGDGRFRIVVVVVGLRGRGDTAHNGCCSCCRSRCWGRERRWWKIGMRVVAFLVAMFGACWRPGFFRPGRGRALSGIGRVSPTSGVRGFVRRDGIAPFPKALDVPADT